LNLRGIAELELGRVEDATKTLESLTVITAEWAHAGVWIEVGLAEELASRHLASQACRRFVAAAGKGKLEGEAETRLVALGRLLLSDEP
jgi:hypothetical protein